ncbi:glycine zipper 2TM domain-containing protein [Paraburkholderia bonniea]|uniref:glycine zipper 2TM domain-containing protein n=1 Tax=Paraburkholderia bonniea TaxID=2152891 RepID=UPI0012915232|nr:glycine zipper 2TM domain-containing protein [Paraburkholderia bonniea]
MDHPNRPSPETSRRLHPLIATAAGAVIIASLVATAAITGLIPNAASNRSSASPEPAMSASAALPGPAATADALQATAQRVPPSAPPSSTSQNTSTNTARGVPGTQYAGNAGNPAGNPTDAPNTPHRAAAAAATCQQCGTVVAISTVRQQGHGTGLGAVGGAVAGGVVGNQFGSHNGRTAMTLLGALGGGLAGNAVEKHLRSSTAYSVRVQMQSGKTRYFTYHQAPPFQQGQPVRVENGTLVAG